jgi:hypothetical protein
MHEARHVAEKRQDQVDPEVLIQSLLEKNAERWSNYVNVRVRLSETSYIRTTGYVQPRLDAFADVRILNETRLSVAITKRVSLQIRFDLYYDSRPPDNVEDLDVALRNGLSVSL